MTLKLQARPSENDTSYALRMPEIEELAHWVNERARETLASDGEHALMFFLVGGDGQIRPQLVDATTRDEMPEALNRIADEVKRGEATAVVVVGEAWTAPSESVQAGGVAESLEARDILFVAALNAGGGELTLETPVRRDDDQSVTLGETQTTDTHSLFLNPVRRLWGLNQAEG